jgi:transposase-like protein
MIDFPIDELLDDEACTHWLERQLHPAGLRCPHCACAERRVSRRSGYFLGYRCLACDRYFTMLSGTVFARSRQRPAKLVLILRGAACGETTARLARELTLSRKRMHALRKAVQTNLADTLERHVLEDEVLFEADEVYINAGEKKHAAPGPGRSAPQAGQ